MLLVLLAALLGLVLVVAGIMLRQREAPQRLLLILLGILLLLIAGWLHLDRAPEQRAERRTWAPAASDPPLAMEQAFSDAIELPEFAEAPEAAPPATSSTAKADGEPVAKAERGSSKAEQPERAVAERPASQTRAPERATVQRERSVAAERPQAREPVQKSRQSGKSGKSKDEVPCCNWQPVPELRDYPTLDYQAPETVYRQPAPSPYQQHLPVAPPAGVGTRGRTRQSY